MGRGFGSAVDGGVCPPAGEIGHMRREIGGQKGIGAGRLTSGDPVGDTQGVSAGNREGLAGGNGALFFLFPGAQRDSRERDLGIQRKVALVPVQEGPHPDRAMPEFATHGERCPLLMYTTRFQLISDELLCRRWIHRRFRHEQNRLRWEESVRSYRRRSIQLCSLLVQLPQ